MSDSMLKTFEGAPPTTARALDEFERRHGLELPARFREFLLSRNGGRPERDLFAVPTCSANPVARLHFFFGLGDPEKSCDLEWNLGVFSDRIPARLLPIATTEGADKVCLDLRSPNGPVLYWDAYATGSPGLHPVAHDFSEFLELLTDDELSPSG